MVPSANPYQNPRGLLVRVLLGVPVTPPEATGLVRLGLPVPKLPKLGSTQQVAEEEGGPEVAVTIVASRPRCNELRRRVPRSAPRLVARA